MGGRVVYALTRFVSGMAFILIICLVVGYDVIREGDGHAVEREFAIPMGVGMHTSSQPRPLPHASSLLRRYQWLRPS